MQAARNETNEARIRRDVIGALMSSKSKPNFPRDVLEGRVDLVYEHACRALANAQSHSQIFLMPLWRFLDRSSWMFRGSALQKRQPSLPSSRQPSSQLHHQDRLRFEGNGKLKPTIERQVFAHVDGEVQAVYVKHSQIVKEGDVLVELKNRDLDQQIVSLQGEIQLRIHQVHDGEPNTSKSAASNTTERDRLAQEIAESRPDNGESTEPADAPTRQKDKAATPQPDHWDNHHVGLEKVLNARPVVTGQVLMNVADPDGDWFIEVLMPEKRMRIWISPCNKPPRMVRATWTSSLF